MWVISLERVQQASNYCFSKLDAEGKAAVAEAIFRRRTMTWDEVRKADRHGLGCEKIAKDSIKVAMPPFITEDAETLLVFRYHGMAPMVGFRKNNIFYALWFDKDFTLYDHG